ncbi:phosphatase PAP2 family protein [Chitinophaga arvensicola]|uniref:Membrane-associated phospholipid phosphatase n=1 Tax=Chitinophaga arvensicola TaxID=29529 RepID=A0A1I0S5W3_9BACT|nr:phosphatase PAP2 family protein [Chitinophaga arvensicola]SEW50693.1 Membrane-associated phospholipid phosphatase [Chitinophaga arvensicola]
MNAFLQRFIRVYQEVKWLLWPFIVIVLTVLSIRMIVTRQQAYFFINKLHTPAGDLIFPYITQLGSVSAAVLISLLLLLISKRKGAMLATAYLFTSAISFSLKALVGFPRPHRYFAAQLHDIYFVPGVAVLDNFRSFPSGHSVCAFTAATVLSYYTKNKYWSLLYLGLALLVGYSRMYMSQHFLEDVTAGASLGVFFSMVWISLFKAKTAPVSGQ